jgi:hypothetical protein
MGILSITFWVVGIIVFIVVGIFHFVPWWLSRFIKKSKKSTHNNNQA